MLQRRRWLLLGGAGLVLLLFVLSLVKGQWPTAVIFGALLVINARGYFKG
jgi:anaerobic C4-dicarboxylate transporter